MIERPRGRGRPGREPVWLRVARRFMPEGMNTGDLYAACKWSQGCAYWRRRTENLKLMELVLIADAIGAPFPLYVDQVVTEIRALATGKIARKVMPLRRSKMHPKDRGNAELMRAMAQITPLRHGKTKRGAAPGPRR